jgi:Hypothetical protein (DUF2513)
MKRDWDVIREVLLEVEQIPHEARTTFGYQISAGQTAVERSRAEHAFLLQEAGYVSALHCSNLDAGNVMLGPELSWAGHDLLDTLRSKPVWERIKTTAKEKGVELTFDAVKALGKVALEYVIKQGGT